MISEKEYKICAERIGCNVAAVKAVRDVESGNRGFYASGKVVLKFEGHIFRKYTNGRYDALYPTLSYKKWTERYSEFGERAYLRFNQAFALDRHAAMMATSWGLFQLMGFNHSSCGFSTVDEFVAFHQKSEDNHLEAFCRYIINQGLAKYIRSRNWAAFAYRYNGADYKKYHYDLQLEAEYAKYNP